MTTRRPLYNNAGTPTEISNGDLIPVNLLQGLTVVGPKTGAYTANANEIVLVDTTSGNVPITLPTAPADGTRVAVEHSIRGGFNSVSLALGGSDVFNVSGGPTTGSLITLNQGALWQYVASSAIWVTISSHLALSQLDNRYTPALLLSTGEETIFRDNSVGNNVGISTSTLRLTYFRARKSESSTQVRTTAGGVATAGATLCKVGVYSIDSSGNGTLVASTANDTTIWAATGTVYTRSWASSFSKVAGQMYAMGVLMVGTTAPQLMGTNLAAVVANEFAIDPRMTGSIGSQSDLPSTFTAGSVAVSTARIYGAILP